MILARPDKICKLVREVCLVSKDFWSDVVAFYKISTQELYTFELSKHKTRNMTSAAYHLNHYVRTHLSACLCLLSVHHLVQHAIRGQKQQAL